jgi:multidrug/hemolysin transport system permease protein
LLLIVDVIFLVLFGTALSSVINSRLSTNGQASAVGTIVSSGYGFLCGAYMPISNFPAALRGVISFLPGTYGTSLLRTHVQSGVYSAMEKEGFSPEVIAQIKDSTDVNLYFFDAPVSMFVKYLILIGSAVIITLLCVLLCKYERKKKRK